MKLDPRLEVDSTFVTNLNLCQVRLHHNAVFPWTILVPNRDDIIEIIDLNSADQLLLMKEMSLMSEVMCHLYRPTKLNVANLGNVVPQLHIHIIARFSHDKAWPGSVWNSGLSEPYTLSSKEKNIAQLKTTIQMLNNGESLD
ncbi:MAG: HIT domain-containing protein [Proteobacteria bacterium]|nr:HIT domain-containing protein [Pseudomonadota bacterium]